MSVNSFERGCQEYLPGIWPTLGITGGGGGGMGFQGFQGVGGLGVQGIQGNVGNIGTQGFQGVASASVVSTVTLLGNTGSVTIALPASFSILQLWFNKNGTLIPEYSISLTNGVTTFVEDNFGSGFPIRDKPTNAYHNEYPVYVYNVQSNNYMFGQLSNYGGMYMNTVSLTGSLSLVITKVSLNDFPVGTTFSLFAQ